MCTLEVIKLSLLCIYIKGCVQGYGKYDDLTSSGIDPRELFDDMEDTEIPNVTTTNVVMDECSDIIEAANQQHFGSSDHIHLLPMGKARRHSELSNSEDDPVPTFSQLLDGGSVYTRPSLFSLISMPGEVKNNRRLNVVCISVTICPFVLPL